MSVSNTTQGEVEDSHQNDKAVGKKPRWIRVKPSRLSLSNQSLSLTKKWFGKQWKPVNSFISDSHPNRLI